MTKTVQLTAAEKAERAAELAGLIEEIQEIEERRKDAMAEFRKELKGKADRAKELARIVSTGQEKRESARQISMAEYEQETNGAGKKSPGKGKAKP